MIRVLVLNKLNYVTVAKFWYQKIPLIWLSELKSLLDDAATIFTAGQFEHLSQDLVNYCSLLLNTTTFQQFLNNIVTKNIIYKLLTMWQRLLENKVLKRLGCEQFGRHGIIWHQHIRVCHLTILFFSQIQSLLNVPAPVLINGTLVDMWPQNMIINIFLERHFLDEFFKEFGTLDLNLRGHIIILLLHHIIVFTSSLVLILRHLLLELLAFLFFITITYLVILMLSLLFDRSCFLIIALNQIIIIINIWLLLLLLVLLHHT